MSHVSGLFTRRGFNIDSIAVGETDNIDRSIITIVLKGVEQTVDQVESQLLKLADVIELKRLPYHDSVVRELLLIRVSAKPESRGELFGIVEVFGGKIVEITSDSLLVEMHGNSRQVNGFIQMMKQVGILEIARTGQIALSLLAEENDL